VWCQDEGEREKEEGGDEGIYADPTLITVVLIGAGSRLTRRRECSAAVSLREA